MKKKLMVLFIVTNILKINAGKNEYFFKQVSANIPKKHILLKRKKWSPDNYNELKKLKINAVIYREISAYIKENEKNLKK